jgi:hypothetical protein
VSIAQGGRHQLGRAERRQRDQTAGKGVSASHITEVLVVGGERFRVLGRPDEVETKILEAARGSLMELVWLTEVESGQSLGLNPQHVVAVRPSSP